MSFCPVIEIFPDVVGRFQTSDGRIILDNHEATTVSLHKTLQVQDDAYTIGSIDDITLSVPNSPKNFYYLKHLFDPATGQPTNLHIVVRMSLGSETLYHDRLYVLSKSFESIELKLVYSANWKKKLQNLKVAQLPLGILTFTQTYIEDNWANNTVYADGDVGHWFPMVDYGGWREKGKIVVEDLRPFFHTLFLIQLMFKEIGWCIEFPFYETELGRRCIDYILRDDYGDSESLRNLRLFNARKFMTANQVWQSSGTTGTLIQLQGWEELLDNGNSFEPSIGVYDNVFEGKFKLTIRLGGGGFTPGQGSNQIKFILFKKKTNVTIDEVENLGEIIATFTTSQSVYNLEVETTVTPSDTVFIMTQSDIVILPALVEISWSNEVTRTFYAKGDVIPLQSVVDQSLSCYDKLLGDLHFCAGIIDEYPQYKKVRILTPFDANIFGESIQGYFQNGFVSLRNKQPINSTNSLVRNPDQLRYIKIAFAKTSDEVTKQFADDSTELYSKTIDLGEPYLEDVEELRNPLFEFTVLRGENNFVFQGTSSWGDPGFYLLPQMTDNADGDVSNSIAPRKLIAHGYDKQFDGQRGLIVWENQFTNNIAFAAQEANNVIFGTPGVEPEHKLIYGNTLKDLWSLVLSRFYLQFRGRLQMDLLAYLSNEEFFRFNNRNKFEIEYDGHPIVGRIVTLNDYQPCNVVSAQLLLIPELTTDLLCAESEEEPQCSNNPVIVDVFENGCWTFSITGEFDCNIEQITWLINRDSDAPGLWTEVGIGSSVQLCGETENFIIRAQIEYDCSECPDDDISLYIQPCAFSVFCQLQDLIVDGELWIVYNLDYFTPQGLGSSPDCEETITLTVFSQDGDLLATFNSPFGNGQFLGWQLITLFDPDWGNAYYVLDVVLDCDNGCPDLETQCTYNVGGQPPPPNGNCEFVPELVCVPVTINGILCYTFALENAGDYQYFVVSWECQNGMSGQWMPGDDPICECGAGYIEANAMVHYCDCEPICTAYINCDQSGCLVVNAGTALEYVACN